MTKLRRLNKMKADLLVLEREVMLLEEFEDVAAVGANWTVHDKGEAVNHHPVL